MCNGNQNNDKSAPSSLAKEQNNDEVTTKSTKELSKSNSDGFEIPWPEEKPTSSNFILGIIERWTYSYMSPVLAKGSRQTLDDGTHLCEKDIYRVPSTMESKLLMRKFMEFYIAAQGKKNRLINTLWNIAAPTFVPAGFCHLVTVACQVSLPLLVRELLQILEDHPGHNIIRIGMPYAIGIFLCLFLNSLGNHRYRHLATKSGVIMRSALVACIYERAIRLTPNGKAGLTSGEVTNLVAIDTHKLFEVTQEGHLVWSMPLTMVLVTTFLLLIIGPTSLVGMMVLILFVPLVERVASRMLAIRQKRVKLTDKRVEVVSSMLQGIKVTKLNNYEENYRKRVADARKQEVAFLRRELAYWAVTLVITVVSPVLASAATFTTFVLVNDDNLLTSSMTFTVLLLYIALRFPINYTGRLIGRAAQALASVRRIENFLQRNIRDEETIDTLGIECNGNSSDDFETLKVSQGTFIVGDTAQEQELHENNTKKDKDEEQPMSSPKLTFEVSGLDFSLKRGEVLAICGPVGAGKSTVINGIINEANARDGTMISMKGKVSYVSQTPFILNATLRDNILFGQPLHQEWYDKVLDACCLRPDIRQLGTAGDLTEIGERGVTLSGGQKQRVSLARAAYARPDLVLMDDPLSALDAGTSKKIFEQLIKSEKSILSKSAIVLVTHAAHFLNHVDKVLVVVGGEAKFLGTFDELGKFEPSDMDTSAAVDFIRTSVQEGVEDEDDEDGDANKKMVENGKLQNNATNQGVDKENDGHLMTIEEREHGISKTHTWLLWFKHAGGLPFLITQIFLMTLDRLAYVATEYWLARWTEGVYNPVKILWLEFDAQSDGLSAQYQFVKVYAIILVLSVSLTFARSEWVVTGGERCAKNVFKGMLSSVLLAPMSYFETTPLGRILNRFTYDMEVIDHSLTEAMSVLLIASSWGVASIIVMCTILPWIAFILFPVIVTYWMLSLHYRKSGADLQRIDAVARSPIQAMVAEGLEGTAIIRVFRQVETFVNRFHNKADKSSSALLNFISAQRWLGFRIELLGSSIVLVACVLVVALNESLALQPGIVALLIIWASNFTITLGFLVDGVAEAEAAITSIERVDAMTTIPRERPMITDKENEVDKSWPQSGRLEFQDVCMRYRPGLPLALNKLSFQIPPGKRCGVVGRTGAGKSSLTAALFRLVEIESGDMKLDGVCLSKLGLSDVRGRANGMAIIPQDPFIAGTTMRECLDPFQQSSDDEILEALVAVRLAKAGSDLSILDDKVAEGGSNFSVGERQLLNLARAFLSKPRLLVLDEATASIDGETDAFIQRMLRTRFKGTTLITVAHRLNTIMDYDIILVMDKGRAAELGSPMELLEKGGVFAELVNATGTESALALRQIAKESARNKTDN